MLGVDPNTWALIVLAALQGINLYYTRRTEKNTNSLITTALLRTAESSHAAGRDEMRTEGEAKAATLAEGVKQGESAGKT